MKFNVDKILLLLLGIFMNFNLTGQAGFTCNVFRLTEVNYHTPQSNPNAQIKVYIDQTAKYPNVPSYYVNPIWTAVDAKPVAYVSGNKAKVGAKFELTSLPQQGQDPIHVKGVTPQGYELGSQPLIVNTNSIVAEYPAQEFNKPFLAGLIRAWDEFKIEWYVTRTPEVEDSWTKIDESIHPLYVTLRTPELAGETGPSLGYFTFHTLLKLSCNAGDKLGADEEIIDAIWEELETLNIQSGLSSSTLTYYKNWVSCLATNAQDLLFFLDGQCGSFARMFVDMLKIHNIQHSSVNDDIYMVHAHSKPGTGLSNPAGFFVANWTFNVGQYTDLNSPYPYEIIPYQEEGVDKLIWFQRTTKSNNKYNFHYSDATDDPGVDGQGPNNKPESIFGNHQFANIQGRLLDPSYGLKYADLSALQAKISGYFAWGVRMIDETRGIFQGIDVNGDGDTTSNVRVDVIIISTDANNFELKRSTSKTHEFNQ